MRPVLTIFALLAFFAFLAVFGFGPKERIVPDSALLLRPPANLKGDFSVATTAPSVEAYLMSGLPQEGPKTLWSSWGNGTLASNGKYYTAIGNHLGYNGTSFVYEFDPSSRTLKKIVDVAQAIGQKKGDYGHGKIHAGMFEYSGGLYFATYRGETKQLEEAVRKGYKGSLLFRYDLKTQKLENLGAIAPAENLPVSALDNTRGILYFNTVPKGNLLAYDLKKRAVKFQGGASYLSEYRCMMVTRDGLVYFTNDKGKLSYYHPEKNAIVSTESILPGEKNTLRAATNPAGDGRIFGMTKGGRFFEFQPSQQKVKDLGPNFLSGDYTAALPFSSDNKYVYFAPGAHGSGTTIGTPLVQYDVKSGKRKVLAFLNAAMVQKAGYNIAGNYNLVLDSKGSTLYATFNGAMMEEGKKRQPTFGLPSVLMIKIPDSER